MLFSWLNNNKVVWAVTMLIFNIGSRFVLTDITSAHERALTHVAFKRLVVFCMFFVATRDVVLSIILTLVFVLIFNFLLHDKSRLCIIPGSRRCTTRRRNVLPHGEARIRRRQKEAFAEADADADADADDGEPPPSEKGATGWKGTGFAAAFLTSLAFVPV